MKRDAASRPPVSKNFHRRFQPALHRTESRVHRDPQRLKKFVAESFSPARGEIPFNQFRSCEGSKNSLCAVMHDRPRQKPPRMHVIAKTSKNFRQLFASC